LNSGEMAADYIARALRHLREAKTAFEEKDYASVVRRAQEAVELACKAVLRLLGIEFPKVHDVSDVFSGIRRHADIPEWFAAEVPRCADALRKLAGKRGLAFYGLERELIPACELFREDDGATALQDAEHIYALCKRLINEWCVESEDKR